MSRLGGGGIGGTARLVRIPGWLPAGAVLAVLSAGLVLVPPDRSMGDLGRILYVHVPAAWLGYLAFFVTMSCSAAYLWRRDLRFDRVAASSAELGLLFTAVTIVTGSIWGRATWGVWWDWDPRLTTTAILFVIYLGYTLLRSSLVERERRARLAAVLGITGFVDVPIVHFSVLWWRGLHQPPTVIRPGDPTIDHLFLAVLLASVAAFTLLYAWLLARRVDLELLRDEAELVLESARATADG